MDKSFENSLEGNEKISDEFKTLAITCFGRIFLMLGTNNFERWIDKRNLSERLKKLVIEAMTEEEIKKHPITLGYYTLGTDRIKVINNNKNVDVKDVTIHEGMHFLTDIPGRFCTFLDEGLTEYLKGMAINGPRTYRKNVLTVKFLHQMLGDSIIKAYLTGNIDEFNDKFANLIYNGDKKQLENSKKDISKFYNDLDKFHRYVRAKQLYNEKRQSSECGDEELKSYEADYKEKEKAYIAVESDVLKMFQRIIVGRTTQMARNFEFYKNGRLDLEFANKTIQDMIKSPPFTDLSINFRLTQEMMHQTLELSFQSIIENSHLLAYEQGDEKETKKQMLLDKLVPNVVITDKQLQKIPVRINNDDPAFASKNSSVVVDLLHMIGNDEDLSIQEYLERLAVLQGKMNISDEEMEYVLAKHVNKFFKSSNSPVKISMAIIKAFPRFRKINQLQSERDKNTVETRYRSIGTDCYIEKRDNQFFYIEIDENGEFIEHLLPYRNNIVFSKSHGRLDISCIESLSDVQAQRNGISITLGEEISFEEMKKAEIERALTENIREKIQSSKYMSILDDAPNPYEIEGVRYTAEVDERSRKIDFNQFISDMRDIIEFIDDDKKRDLIDSLTTELIDRVYGTALDRKKGKNANELNEIYSTIRNQLRARINPLHKKDASNNFAPTKLDKEIDALNQYRKERVKNSASTALVCFATPSAEYQYMQKMNKRCIKENVKNFPYREYYKVYGEIPTEHILFSMPGVYTTQPIDSRPVDFRYKDFCEALRNIVSSGNSSISDQIFNEIMRMQIQTMYFRVPTNLEKKPDLKEAFEYVRESFRANVFENAELDDDKILERLAVLNDYRVTSIEQAKKTAAVCFLTPNARRAFFTAHDALNFAQQSGVRTDDLEKIAKGIVDIAKGETLEVPEKNPNDDNDQPNI